MRQGVLWINNGFCFPSLLYPLPSRVGMGQGQRYWHDREMGSFIYLRGEIPVSVLPAHEAAVHAERKEAFHSLPAHVLPASGSSRATGETLGELGWGLPYQVTPGPFSCWLLLAWLFLFFFFSSFFLLPLYPYVSKRNSADYRCQPRVRTACILCWNEFLIYFIQRLNHMFYRFCF